MFGAKNMSVAFASSLPSNDPPTPSKIERKLKFQMDYPNQPDADFGRLNKYMMDIYDEEKWKMEEINEQIEECRLKISEIIKREYPQYGVEAYGSTVNMFCSDHNIADFSIFLEGDIYWYFHKPPSFTEQSAQKISQSENVRNCTTGDGGLNHYLLIVFNWKSLNVQLRTNSPSVVRNRRIQRFRHWEPQRFPALCFWVRKWSELFEIRFPGLRDEVQLTPPAFSFPLTFSLIFTPLLLFLSFSLYPCSLCLTSLFRAFGPEKQRTKVTSQRYSQNLCTSLKTSNMKTS